MKSMENNSELSQLALSARVSFFIASSEPRFLSIVSPYGDGKKCIESLRADSATLSYLLFSLDFLC